MKKIFFMLISGLAFSIFVSSSALSSNNKEDHIVILFKIENGSNLYEINDKQMSLEQLKSNLREHIKARGKSCQIIVLAHSDVNFSNLNNLRGLIWKVGFKDIRYFFYNEDTQMMLEFFFCNQAIPFSEENFNHSQ